jgi:hypothetical protein
MAGRRNAGPVTRQFVVIYEADADFRTATELADRVLLERIDWLEPGLLDSQRTWVGRTPTGELLAWKHLRERARDAGFAVRGHFNNEPGVADALTARRTIEYVRNRLPEISALILVRDSDNDLLRRKGLNQARDADRSGLPIVLGLAIHERESWVLSGFVAENEVESERLREARRELGFDPTKKPEELTATKDDAALRSPKRVLQKFLEESQNGRQSRCWTETTLEQLRENGGRNGLAEFLKEIETKLVPLLTGRTGTDG